MGAELAQIKSADVPAVARFMNTHLNRRVPASRWAQALSVPWQVEAPNHGYFLRQDGGVVGAYLAYYSERPVDGLSEQFCNLGAWCVIDGHRHLGIRLLSRLLGQKGYHFTDFSPSGNVVPLNRRLKFTDLDTTTTLVPNVPLPRRRGDMRVTARPDALLDTLSGEELALYRDHQHAAAAKHLLVSTPREHCYVVFRRDSRKKVRAFGSLLHVSNPELFRAAIGQVSSHLLTRYGIAATLVELRIAGGRPASGTLLKTSRPKMFRSETLNPDKIDYMYSELTCLAW
jgi:hypothetical protein